jgi:flagellum-specific ATP synthase
MPMVCSREHMGKAQTLRRLLAAYSASEDLIRIGAYQKGSDPVLDKALAILPELNRFLEQTASEAVRLNDNIDRLLALPS